MLKKVLSLLFSGTLLKYLKYKRIVCKALDLKNLELSIKYILKHHFVKVDDKRLELLDTKTLMEKSINVGSPKLICDDREVIIDAFFNIQNCDTDVILLQMFREGNIITRNVEIIPFFKKVNNKKHKKVPETLSYVCQKGLKKYCE